jgi:hypothetical protein
VDTTPYKGCTLEYWAKCMSQAESIAFCNARGSDLFSYIDGTDLAAVDAFVSRQSSADREASVLCSNPAAAWPDLDSAVWTGLRSSSNSSTCGSSCVWQVRFETIVPSFQQQCCCVLSELESQLGPLTAGICPSPRADLMP